MIETEALTRRFGERTAVDRLTVHVDAGEILGLLGPNGAGKTTTLRMLAGIIGPSGGTARVCGEDPAAEPERVHAQIGLLTESPGFYDRLSARRNLLYFARFYDGIDAARAVDRAIDRMGLTDRAGDAVGTFSKGMKQRLALARVLVHEPRVLFLDEPTAGLDPEAARDLRELVSDLRKEGRTILLCTHNLAEAELLSDRIAIFNTRLVALDTPTRLREAGDAPAVRLRLAGGTDGVASTLESLSYVRHVQRLAGDVFLIFVDEIDRDRPRLVEAVVDAGGDIVEIGEERRSLEDVYLKLVREGEG